MRQVILYDDHSSKFELFKNLLDNELHIDVSEISSIDQLINIIPILPELDLIVLDVSSYAHKEIATKLDDYLEKQNSKIHVFLIGDTKTTRAQTTIFDKKTSWENIISELKKVIFQHELLNKSNELPQYVPIHFEFIKKFYKIPIPADIYFRIKITDDEFQFVKRLNAYESFTDQEIQNYMKHNIENIYIANNDYKYFLNFSLKLINSDNRPASNPQTKIIEQNVNFHITRDALSLIGVNEETLSLVTKNINEMEEMIGADNALAIFLRTLRENQLSYAYSHSYLLGIILTKVVGSFEWDSKEIKKRICYLSYFHDISLSDDRLIQIHSEDQLYFEEKIEFNFKKDSEIKQRVFSFSEIDQVKSHALNSSLIIEKIPGIPMGVSQVIKEHHGSKNGIGFNDQQSISIQPLSMIFMVVEDFVHAFLLIPEPKKADVHKIADALIVKYTKGNYRKAAEHLKAILPK